MVNYQNGKIYKIINENNEIIYIGSTSQKLCKRYSYHKYKAPNIEEHSDLLNEIRAYSNEEVKKKIIRQCSKKWYDNNKKYKKQKNKEWCENNKEYYQQYYKKLNEKVICKFCNSASSKHNLKRHQESKKCM